METITIEINKRTAAGKTVMGILEYFSKNSKGVKIKKTNSKNPTYPVSKNNPNAATMRSMEKTKKRIDLTHCDNSDDMFKKLGI